MIRCLCNILYASRTKSLFVFLLCLCFYQCGKAQKTSLPTVISNDDLYQKYLSEDGNTKEKILELKTQAEYHYKHHDFGEAFHKLQIALLLQRKSSRQDSASFELYLSAGELISSIHKGYALQFFKKATEIASHVKLPVPRLYHMFTNRAGSHQYLMQYDSARFYYYKAIQTSRIEGGVSESSTLNNLGYFFSHIGQHDSARIYFQKALIALGSRSIQPELYAAIKDNIAQLDFQAGHYSKALETYQNNDSIYKALDLDIDYLINKVRLLQALDKLGSTDVHTTIQETQRFVDQNIDHLWDNPLLDFYRFANDYYFDEGDRDDQIFYRREYRKLKDKVEKDNIERFDHLAQSLLAIQESSFVGEINAYQMKVESDKVKLKSIRFVAIAATVSLLLIILILILYIRQRRFEHLAAKKIAEAGLKTKEMESRLLLQDLELKKRDLTNVVLHNTQLHDSNQKIIDRLSEIGNNKKNIDQQLHSLLVDLQSQNQISERTIGIQENIDSVNAEFYEKLKTRFPRLTKSEAELCGYIRINLSNKDICVLKGVEPNSVKMSKFRLKKRLGLAPEEDLYGFIQGI